LRGWAPHYMLKCNVKCRLCCTPLEKAAPGV